MPITAVYAGLLALVFLYLSAQVIRQRRGARVAIGDGGNALLLRRMRVHANFAEYVPLALVMMALAENLRTPGWLLHVVGLTLVVGRGLHAFGVSQMKEDFRLRTMGMMSTFGVLAVLAFICLAGGLLGR